MRERRLERKGTTASGIYRELDPAAIDGGVALVCVNDIDAIPVPRLHVHLPQAVLMVSRDTQPAANAGNRRREIERRLVTDTLDDARAHRSARKSLDLLQHVIRVVPLESFEGTAFQCRRERKRPA